jgi:hypothetical protein
VGPSLTAEGCQTQSQAGPRSSASFLASCIPSVTWSGRRNQTGEKHLLTDTEHGVKTFWKLCQVFLLRFFWESSKYDLGFLGEFCKCNITGLPSFLKGQGSVGNLPILPWKPSSEQRSESHTVHAFLYLFMPTFLVTLPLHL